MQTEAKPGAVVQFHPEIIVQFARHPSIVGLRFPSSHSSGEAFNPFPHTAHEPDPDPMQYPFGSIVQRFEHPSPVAMFPSSHISVPFLTPSPQRVQELAPTPIHYEFASIWQ